VLGLRASSFFLLRGAANKFDYLREGIAIVLLWGKECYCLFLDIGVNEKKISAFA
jgi:hypothetical protein